MRLQLTIVLTIVLLCVASNNCTAGGLPDNRPKYFLTAQDLTRYQGPPYTKQTLTLPKGSTVLIITRDFGSGFEMREAYLYVGDGKGTDESWRQFSYIWSGSPRITGELTNKDLVLKSADDKVLLSIPIESLESPK
jgi:hypothetical protein